METSTQDTNRAAKLDADIKTRREELSKAEARAESRVKQILGDIADIARVGREIDRLTEERRAVLRQDAPRWPESAIEQAVGRFHTAVKRLLASKEFHEDTFFAWFSEKRVAFAQW